MDQSGIGPFFKGAIFTATLSIDAGASAGDVPKAPFAEVRDESGVTLRITLTDGVVSESGPSTGSSRSFALELGLASVPESALCEALPNR